MCIQRYIPIIFLWFFAIELPAQNDAASIIATADRHFEEMAYARAIDGYKAAVDLGARNDHVTKRLAESYMNIGNTVEAERWYSVVVKFLNREKKDLFNYAQALKSNGKYAEAEEWMDLYLSETKGGGDERSKISGFARKFVQDTDRFKVRSVSVNSEYSDFAPAWLGKDQVMFSTARNKKVGVERIAAWDHQPFLDLYIADISADGDLVNARPLPGNVNTRYHEGPATASASGDVIWFTRNNYYKGKAQKSQRGISRLSIFKATQQTGRWTGIEQFIYNNSEVSTGHPALSPDGKSLYFVSDMPGGLGGTDIYVCRDKGGKWGEPQNLGPAVNTPYNEVFPFISSDGTLYFSSIGHPGLGGLDVFAAKPGEKGEFKGALNVGAPINSPKDDMGFMIDANNRKGYFSSDREGGKGDDDLYAFEMFGALEERYMVLGTVIDQVDDIPLLDAEVQLLDMDGKVLETTRTDPRGEYAFPVEKDKQYKLIAKYPGRYEGQRHFSTEDIEQQQILSRDIPLTDDAGIWLRGVAQEKGSIGFLADMSVSIVNMSSFHSEEKHTNESGDFAFRIQANEDFELHFEKPGYFARSFALSTAGMDTGIIDLNEQYDLSFEPIMIGRPIALGFRPTPGKVKLDAAAKAALDPLVERLTVNPALQIEIGVHSDQRGNENEKLRETQKQADAIKDHLRSKGVPVEQLTAVGYGSSQLLNHCAKGVECTDAEHAVNRRAEYRVIAVPE